MNIGHLLRFCAITIERKCNFTLNVIFLPGIEWQEWVFHFSCSVFNFSLVNSARLDVGCAHWAQPASRRSMSLTLRLLPKFWIQELQNLFDLGSGFSFDICEGSYWQLEVCFQAHTKSTCHNVTKVLVYEETRQKW